MPAKVETPSVVHVLPDSTTRITLAKSKPTPVSCTAHGSVRVQAVSPTNGPDIWKLPTRMLATLPASCAQQSCKALVATPAVAVPKSKLSFSKPDGFTVDTAPA
jgi:hypothetical protein